MTSEVVVKTGSFHFLMGLKQYGFKKKLYSDKNKKVVELKYKKIRYY